MVILEAFAAGLPVVGTDVGGVAELLGQGKRGFLAPAGDVEGLADGCIKVLQDSGLRSSLGSQARTFAKGHTSIDAQVDGYVAAYELVTGAQLVDVERQPSDAAA